MCAVYASGKGIRVYEISDRKDDTAELLDFLRNCVTGGYRLVGFNNLAFDYPILHYIMEKSKEHKDKGTVVKFTAKELYKIAQKTIDSMKEGGFGSAVKQEKVRIAQVDLFKIHHFDNKARSTSLKVLEFNMRSDNIEDLPFPIGKLLTDEEKDELIKYNKHDVMQTLKFYRYSDEHLKLRDELTELFGFDCTNFNDTKIGKELFIRSLEKESPGCCYTVTERGRKINQTKREQIVIKDCLFPYIKFTRPEFQALHEWFKQQVITETKGVFSDIEEHKLGELAKYAELVVKRKKFKAKPDAELMQEFKQEHPLGWIEEEELKATEYLFDAEGNHVMQYPLDEFGNPDTTKKPKKKRVPKKSYYGCWRVSETLNVIINGFRYDFGVGGIHGAKQGTHVSTADKVIKTYDVASYYPNMAISNQIYQKHLGQTFCKVYKDLYELRKSHPKGSAANSALKLALNGTYGDSNNEFSPLYDPAYTMSITIGGQLSLCMIIERIIDEVQAEVLMANTDGFEFICNRNQQQQVDDIVKWWQDVTGLELEGDSYAKMFVRDVNNYISVTEKSKIKLKGAYEFADYDKLGWHKNHSAMVIPKAVKAHLIDGIDYEEFIKLHQDKFDFMLRTKVPRSSSLVLVKADQSEEQLQNICRYYACKTGGKLVKLMPPLEEAGEVRRLGIDTEWNVKPCNDITAFAWDIDYEYYFSEAKKLVEAVQNVVQTTDSVLQS
jgi:hypothetical protein